MEFFATCGTGLEPILGDELRRIGVPHVRPLRAGVSFGETLQDAYRVLLWSRVASRVLLTLARVDAADADELYEGIYRVPWEDHLVTGKTIAVSAHGTSDTLRDTRFTALRAKDAIVDRARDEIGVRPDVDARHPDLLVNVNLHRDRATVSLDLSGSSLENRGYRVAARPHGAPIRENLAAALLLAAGWGKPSLRDALLVNPFCASGTIAIEAALIAGDIAPGIARDRWGFGGWAAHDEALWDSLIDEADERAEARAAERRAGAGKGASAPSPQIVATDADAAALEYARACAKRATVAGAIEFAEPDAGGVPALDALPAHERLVLACNVPTGAKSSRAQLPVLYSELAPLVDAADAAGLLAEDPDIDAFLGRDAADVHEVRNGRDEASLRVYEAASADAADAAVAAAGPAAPTPHTVTVRDQRIAVNDEGAQQFASRLNKVAKERRKWAKKARVHAYRVYDADLPDYNMAIDVYQGAGSCEGRTLVHVAEYAPPKQIDHAKAARRMADALRIIPVVLGVEPDEVYVKRRVRSKGGSQYAAASAGEGAQGRTPRFITEEHGLRFEVDLGDYLDTGLFLDHRDTRALIGTLAKGKSFLNLFAYTGTASVYAAAGGAKFTTTVDISNTYQEWARRNFKMNNLLDEHQEFVRADVLTWVNEMRHSRNRWDLVFVDPPTFSNSSKMGGRDWDVQRDHAELLIDVSRLLTRQGVAVFSCNLRKFRLDTKTLAKASVQAVDITAKTIPHDFERNPKVHHCFLLRRVG